jgi:hypothetical protein
MAISVSRVTSASTQKTHASSKCSPPDSVQPCQSTIFKENTAEPSSCCAASTDMRGSGCRMVVSDVAADLLWLTAIAQGSWAEDKPEGSKGPCNTPRRRAGERLLRAWAWSDVGGFFNGRKCVGCVLSRASPSPQCSSCGCSQSRLCLRKQPPAH